MNVNTANNATCATTVPRRAGFAASSRRGESVVPDLSIIIVSWNTVDLLRDCLTSIAANLGSLAAEIIVVDNGSTDGSVAMVTREFPRARVIRNADNRGFAAANNQGLLIATGRFTLLLNPDTVVLGDVLERAIEYAEAHPDVGVLGCKVMRSESEIQRTCFRFPSLLDTAIFASGLTGFFPESHVGGRAAYGPWDRCTERDVDVVSGMFMLVRAKALADVGPMDESYFVYAEETDWCLRFRQAGWRCVFAPVGRILHVDGGGKSTEQVSDRMYVQLQRSLLRYHRKHGGVFRWLVAKAFFAVSVIPRAVGWSVVAAIGGRPVARHKARLAAAAARYHFTGRAPRA